MHQATTRGKEVIFSSACGLPEQVRRLGQIGLQVQGLAAFHEPDVAAALKLSTQQRKRIQAIEQESFFGPKEGNAAPERAVAELTEEQNRAWNEMTGEPFTGEMLLPPQFGPPPGTGPVRPRPARL